MDKLTVDDFKRMAQSLDEAGEEEDVTCSCAAHCWCECACGAWNDTINEPCFSCGANGGWDEWEDSDDEED